MVEKKYLKKRLREMKELSRDYRLVQKKREYMEKIGEISVFKGRDRFEGWVIELKRQIFGY